MLFVTSQVTLATSSSRRRAIVRRFRFSVNELSHGRSGLVFSYHGWCMCLISSVAEMMLLFSFVLPPKRLCDHLISISPSVLLQYLIHRNSHRRSVWCMILTYYTSSSRLRPTLGLTAMMCPTHTSPMARASCSACPRGENVSPGTHTHKSTSHNLISNSPGRRPAGACRSFGDTSKHRHDLGTTTNIPTVVTSAASSPGSATKQKWFASLRSRASHIPMPTSPSTIHTSVMSSSAMPTSTISRLFKTPPHGKNESPTPDLAGDISPPAVTNLFHPVQGTSPDPLPRLVLPSFDPLSDVGVKYDAEVPGKDVQPSEAGQTRFPGLKAAKYNMKCDVYYPPVPWEPSRTEQFDDATAALSSFCLNTVLNEGRTYSNIILWTSYTPRGEPSRRQQRFTVLPSYLKPDRNSLCRDDKYDWAIIVFRDEAVRSRLPEISSGQHGSLQNALARVTAMGYHVDV